MNMEKIKKWAYQYKHFLLVSYYFISQIWFMYCEKTVVPKFYMESRWDAYIPFVKVFVVPYLIWFAYMAAGFLYLGLKSKRDFYRLCLFMFGGMTICYILYMVFPNAQRLRPLVVEGNDVFARMIRHIYSTDTSTNVAPSIHVLNSLAVHIALIHAPSLKKNILAKTASLTTAFLIISSTVLIKQHSIKDVFWSFVLASVLYVVIYRLLPLLRAYHLFRRDITEASVADN